MPKFFDWFVMALMVGVCSAFFLWYADVAWLEQGFTFGAAATMGLWGWKYTNSSNLHPLYLRDNPGPGLIRFAVWAGMLWCIFTIMVFGSERIVGVWHLFYLIIGFGAIQVFGVKGAETFGVRVRPDVFERKNWGAAMFIAAFVLSTGMIYGGSMWGESEQATLQADLEKYGGVFQTMPSYDDGWWIIMLFFLLGWSILFVTMKLWFLREKSVTGSGIRRDRLVEDGRAAALYCLGVAIPLTDAVSGDYYGIEDSLVGFSVIALPVMAHEFLRPPSAEAHRDPSEPWLYILIGIAATVLSPIISSTLGFR